MWFNNLVIYQFNTPFGKSTEALAAALDEWRLKPCPPHARQSQGFVAPIQEEQERVYSLPVDLSQGDKIKLDKF